MNAERRTTRKEVDMVYTLVCKIKSPQDNYLQIINQVLYRMQYFIEVLTYQY